MECVFHSGPVTALCVVGDNIIAGSGDYLYLYSAETLECKQRLSPLHCTRIHGIKSDTQGLLCIHGEKRACIVKFTSDSLECTDRAVLLQDLIWDSQFLKNKGMVVFALAHNVIIRWDSCENKILDIVQCEENSILYCARFITSSWENLILAAGTVINQVLLWSPMTPKNENGRCHVIQRFKGHQGVIFSVRYNAQKHQICSVSDDRSIRIWQLKFPRAVAMELTLDDLELEDWNSCTSTPLHVLYGHSARVWDINFLSNVMISIGEDSVCCVWNYKGEVIQRFKGHKGKSIWSLASSKNEQFFVTGGGDTSIRMWKLNTTENQSADTIKSQSLSLCIGDDFVRVVTFWKSDFVLGMTNDGSLVVYSNKEKRSKVIFTDPDFKSYTVMAVSDVIALGNIRGVLRLIVGVPGNDTENFCGLTFHWTDHILYSGKVFSIHWLNDARLLTTGPDGEIKCFKMEYRGSNSVLQLSQRYTLPHCKQRWVSAAALTSRETHLICGDRAGTVHVYKWGGNSGEILEPTQSFWKIHGKTGVTDIITAEDTIYTAGRDGHYREYKMEDRQIVLLNSNRVYKGFDWLDKLELQPDGDVYIYGFQSDCFVLFSLHSNQKLLQIPCGGGHRTWDCQISNDKAQFVYLKMRDVVLCDTDLMTNQVILKESMHGREITCIKHLKTFPSKNGTSPVDLILTCSEDTTILLSCLTNNSAEIIKQSCHHTLKDHISNVKCMTVYKPADDNSYLIFSGGARAQMVITRMIIQKEARQNQSEAEDVQMEADIKSTFQTLKSCHLGEEWLTHKQRKLKSFRSNPEMRIMDLSVVSGQDILPTWPDLLYIVGAACSDGYVRFFIFNEAVKELTPLCESLFHDHCVLKITHSFIGSAKHKQCIFFSGGTDGRIVLWDISKSFSSYNLQMEEGESNATCDFPSASGSDNMLTSNHIIDPNKMSNFNANICDNDVSMSCSNKRNCDNTLPEGTRGENAMAPVFSIKCHQSGINAISTCHISEGTFIIASGGDDNALVVSKVTAKGDNYDLIGQCKELSAHAAQITGVKLISECTILTASVDQRMCLWNVLYTDSKPDQITVVWCKFVSVPDIYHMEIWEDSNKYHIGISGEGLAIFHIDKNKCLS